MDPCGSSDSTGKGEKEVRKVRITENSYDNAEVEQIKIKTRESKITEFMQQKSMMNFIKDMAEVKIN